MSAWETPGASDEWYTPAYIFEAMGPITFGLDVAHPKDRKTHVPCEAYLFADALAYDWKALYGRNNTIWMNAPFGGRNGLTPWLDKFVGHGDGIALVPDRTSAPWFQAAAPRMDAVLFVSPKIKFERPDGSTGDSPGTGTALMAIGPRGVQALANMQGAGHGWLVYK